MPESRPLEYRVDADRFDADWYRRHYPDVESALAGGATALGHYVEVGAGEERHPNPEFRPDWYLERHPRVREAVAAGRLAGAFHDYLLRRAQGLPRPAAPATAILAADLRNADPWLATTLLRLAGRAPGWDFWLVAPPPGLPAGPAGVNLRLVDSPGELPPVDAWIGVGGRPPPAGLDIPLAPLMQALGLGPADRSAHALDRVLERLRALLLAGRAVLPAGRRGSGPVHVDRDRVRLLRLEVTGAGTPAIAGGGVVLRRGGRIVAELPPMPTGAATVADPGPAGGLLWLTVSRGLTVHLRPAAPPPVAVEVILHGRPGQGAADWQRSLTAAAALPGRAALVLADPPAGLEPGDGAVVLPSLAAALAAHPGAALLVPAGVALFPQATLQAADMIASGIAAGVVRPAMRHPDGHLAAWRPERLAHDPEHDRRWRRAGVTLLSAEARRHGAGALSPIVAPVAAPDVAPFGCVDPTAWPSRLATQPALAPGRLRLDCRPGGAVLGRLRVRGAGPGGRLLLAGATAGALADPCRVVATVERRGAGTAVIAGFTLPAAAEFAWPIDLPGDLGAADTVAVAPVGSWVTDQTSGDPRPVLFRLRAVRYRPSGATMPRASRRSR